MAGETIITVVGTVTGDPELKFTQTGTAVAGFTVASNSRRFDKDSNKWIDGDALFLRCSAWRELAENVADTLVKGTRVIVTGALKQRTYETQTGEKRTSLELTVEEVGPSLKWATAKVVKAQRGSGDGAGSQPPASRPAAARPAAAPEDRWSMPAGSGPTDQPPF